MKERFDQLSAECSRITTKRYSTSFSLGILFLQRHLRQPIYSIYGFVRFADEIVDSFHGYDKKALLGKFKADCFEAIQNRISLNPILNAFQEVVIRYNIEYELINLFLNSMEMDLDKKDYSPEKFDEYILGSAQVVGLMCLRVFAEGDDDLYQRLRLSAMRLGSAFQKINFLRDLKADYQLLERCYFPDINLLHFSNDDKKAIEADIAGELEDALNGIRLLPDSSRKGVYLAYCYYRRLFEKIKNSNAEAVMNRRFRISNGRKFVIMFDSLIRLRMNVL